MQVLLKCLNSKITRSTLFKRIVVNNDVPAASLPPKIKMPETTKIPVKPSKANGMKDKKWLTFIRIESNENAQNVSWASFHTIDTKLTNLC